MLILRRAMIKYETAKGLVECILYSLKSTEDVHKMNSILNALSSEIGYCKEAEKLF